MSETGNSRVVDASQALTRRMELFLAQVRAAPGTAALVGVAFLAVAVVYRPVFLWLWDSWMTNPYYSHGLLVLPISAVVAIRRRKRFAARPRLIDDRDYAWLAAAGVLFVGGRYYASNFLQAWSLLPLLVGTLLVTQGRPRTKVLLWPLGFLALVIPLPLLEGFFAPLQLMAAVGAGNLASLMGLGVTWDSVSITVDGMTFAIVPLCAGLSSTLSLFAVTAVATLLWPVTLVARTALFALVVPIALLANMARITSTVLIAVRWGPSAGTGFFHGPGGVLLYLVALASIGGAVLGARKLEARLAARKGGDQP